MTRVARWQALITLIFVALAGPQGTLLVSAIDLLTSEVTLDPDCPAAMCKTRECCCAKPGEAGCRIGPSPCASSDNELPAIAKGLLPPLPAAGRPRERPVTLAADRGSPVDDGFDRRPDRPPRVSS